ncbi:Uncharacterized protein Adt_12165 [Abeliophyllum distichum]|uniref:Reverse transcriptase domain-containing protein n=1 Tax=Abeliophyllum distichum TaxID=126358 RepID=A0ABD1UPZ4_9LAMI
MRILKYSFDFDPHKESSIVPVWIALPKLPLVFYDKAILFSIASVLGTPLKLDECTAKKSRTNLARICVDMDINGPRLDRIRIGNEEFAIWQNIYYENLPLYCSFCKHLGHEVEKCFWKKTTGSKQKTNIEGEGVKTTNDKKKGKAVWVEKQSGEVEQGEIGECSKGNNEAEEENRKQELKTQMLVGKGEDVNLATNDELGKGSEGVEGPQLSIREVDQEENNTGYFDCLKEKEEENSDLNLINQDFQLPEENKVGDILVDQVYVDMGLWNTMEKNDQEAAGLDKALSDSETIKGQVRRKNDEKQPSQITQHSKIKLLATRSPIHLRQKHQKKHQCSFMMDNLLFWNLRGINSSIKRLKKVVHINNVSMLILAEPIVDKGKIQEYKCKLGYDYCHSNRNGKLWVFWNSHLDCQVIEDQEQFISFQTKWREVETIITAVYAKCSVKLRRDLWTDLAKFADKMDKPWLIGGDFNAILNREEREGGNSPDRRSMEDFSNMIMACGVEDVNCRSQFTWSNGRMWEKLDRILVNYQWNSAFEDFKAEVLNRDTSDHCPILIHCSPPSIKPKSSFRFQSIWCHHEGLLEIVKQNWDTPLTPYSKGLFGFFYKIKRLKNTLKRWNDEVFGNIFEEIKKAEKEALAKERTYDSVKSPETREEMHRAYANLNNLLSQEEAFWRQKSGIKWLREGDRNSKYFHAVVKKKRSKNKITQIRNTEGRLITDVEEIQNSAVNYFQNILSREPTEDCSELLEAIPNIITVEENRNLNTAPTIEELKDTVFSLDKDSAAGPDGLSALFYQFCWEVIQKDLHEAVVDFFDGKIIPIGVAVTSIVLLPKKLNAEEWKDFRPISLCNVLNKIMTKILASRLNKLLPKIISPSQSGFTPGRDIGDNILLAQELIYQLDRKTRGGNVVLKLDMAKAYDRVDWSFLMKVLERFGFNHDWIDKIERCISNCGFSIIFNGELKGFFKSSRGLRQGDPISPSLFIILAECFF